MSYIIIPLLVLVATQILKLTTDGIRGNFNLRSIWISYGGMPSAHTAFAISVTTLVGLREGFDHPTFAVALVFTLLIMRDAITYRARLGHQGQMINKLVELLPKNNHQGLSKLPERLGHSVPEVFVGALVGICLTVILNGLL